MIVLSDTFLANSSEPWRLPDVASLPEIDPKFATREPTAGFMPYARDENLRAAVGRAGHAGLRHRIGGLEKEDVTGNISYDPSNHAHMTRLRAERVRDAEASPTSRWTTRRGTPTLLVLGWGSSYGAIQGAARRVRREQGLKVATAHIRHLNPLPAQHREVLRSYPRVLVPEMNMGQLVKILRAEFLVDIESYHEGRRAAVLHRGDEGEIVERIG